MSQAFDPVLALKYAKFIDAAYSMYTTGTDPAAQTPAPSSNFPSGWDLVAWIQMNDFIIDRVPACFYGIIAQETADPTSFVVAIRGTENYLEWFDDFHVFSMPFGPVPSAGHVASGFGRIYETLKVVERSTSPGSGGGASTLSTGGTFSQQLQQVVARKTMEKIAPLPGGAPPAGGAAPTSTSNVVITGHSLGAALATMYAIDNAYNQKLHNPVICTFASPRVGNQSFVDTFNALNVTSWRVVNAQDLVPNVPPDIFGYRHVNEQELFSSLGKVKATPGCWHALATYESLINPAQPIGADCIPTPGDNEMLLTATSGPSAGGGPLPGAVPIATMSSPISVSTPMPTPTTINITVNIR